MRVPSSFIALGIVLLASCSGSKATSQTAPAEATQAPAAGADPALGMGLDPGERVTPEERADRQTTYLTERLGLREEQVAPVRAVALEYAERQASLYDTHRGDRRAMLRGMRALGQEQDAAYRGILDEAQYGELQEVRQEIRGQVRERVRERRGR